jgi:hypothetical protein
MDRSAVQAIVDREAGPLCERLGIERWSIRFSFDPESTGDDGHLKHGECTRLVDYNSAHISLNPESFADEESVLGTLRHELFHVVLAPFDLYSSSVDRALEAGAPVREILDRVWDHACERGVINLERMYVGLIGPDKDE